MGRIDGICYNYNYRVGEIEVQVDVICCEWDYVGVNGICINFLVGFFFSFYFIKESVYMILKNYF